MPFCAWPPFIPPPALLGHIYLYRGKWRPARGERCPWPTGHISSAGSPQLQFHLGPRFALWLLAGITESCSLEGPVSPLRASLGPAAPQGWPPPSCPPLSSARARVPLGFPGDVGNKRFLCARRGGPREAAPPRWRPLPPGPASVAWRAAGGGPQPSRAPGPRNGSVL